MRTALMIACFAFAVSADTPANVRIRATQHGGWWELRYPDGTIAANELHIPVGRGVDVDATLDGAGILRFDDAHWPRIGHGAHVTFNASRGDRATASTWPRGARLTIVADDRFDDWLAQQRRAAARTTSPGETIFLTARCTLCHSVRGVASAEEPVGPDLTHFASRATIGAGTLPNNDGNLSGWIVDAEQLKPGCGMPVNNIDSARLQSLLAYLRTLR